VWEYVESRGDADLFSEFDFRVLGDGRSANARYANNSNYRNDSLIRKESTWREGSRTEYGEKS